MATIIREAEEFAFVHIPKCGGSSVGVGLTTALGAALPGEIRYDGAEVGNLPGGGTYMASHKPLWMLRDHFPEELAAYRRCACFGVVRDPHARFRSAVQQYLREFKGAQIGDLSPKALHEILSELMATLRASDRIINAELVHFIPQADFIRLDDAQLVDHIYPLEQLDKMAGDISVHLGRRVTFDLRTNTGGQRNAALRVLRRIGRPLRRVLPARLYWQAKTRTVAAFTKDTSTHLRNLLDTPDIHAFVESYYARDVAIYAAAKAAFAGNGS